MKLLICLLLYMIYLPSSFAQNNKTFEMVEIHLDTVLRLQMSDSAVIENIAEDPDLLLSAIEKANECINDRNLKICFWISRRKTAEAILLNDLNVLKLLLILDSSKSSINEKESPSSTKNDTNKELAQDTIKGFQSYATFQQNRLAYEKSAADEMNRIRERELIIHGKKELLNHLKEMKFKLILYRSKRYERIFSLQ